MRAFGLTAGSVTVRGREVGRLRRLLQTAGPPLAIGFCVLAVSMLAAGALAAVVLGDVLGDTASDLLGYAGW